MKDFNNMSRKASLDGINQVFIEPWMQTLTDGLTADNIKQRTDADKYSYDDTNFKSHFKNIENNLISCREKCSDIKEEITYREACKKGCYIESPSYCTTECPNEEWNGKLFYFSDKNTPFEGDCNESGTHSENDCNRGKKYFKDIWSENGYKKGYKMSNKEIPENNCEGIYKYYKDMSCNEEITLKERYEKWIISYKEYQKKDTGTYDKMVDNMVKLRKENNKKKILNEYTMSKLIKKYNKIQDGFGNMGQQKKMARHGRIEDRKLLGESEMYKKIAISILGITLLLITAKKLNNL
jgi:hypothetical protein